VEFLLQPCPEFEAGSEGPSIELGRISGYKNSNCKVEITGDVHWLSDSTNYHSRNVVVSKHVKSFS